MGSSKKPKQQVTDYYLSVHYGICWGPVDAVTQLQIGEKEVWSGEVSANGSIPVEKSKLLGGNLKEGGYRGIVQALFGGAGQTVPEHLASRQNEDTSLVPGYRGLFSLIFYGPAYTNLLVGDELLQSFWIALQALSGTASRTRRGFYWGSNSGYIRDLWVRLRRAPKGFYPERATITQVDTITVDGETQAITRYNANPAHIIYECITNQDWGMQGAPVELDLQSFRDAADVLYAEGFGLSMMWTGQSAVEEFVGDVLRHIDGRLDTHPRTGLLTLKLIRADYDPELLPELNPDNCRLTSFSRRAWGDTVNEVVVTWTNPQTEGEETVSWHDLANIAQQGTIVSETQDYHGVREASLAMRLAMRDCAAKSAPLAAVELKVQRTGWDLVPGDVIAFTWPARDIHRLSMRIGTVDYGRPGDSWITVTAVEDVFDLPNNPYFTPPSTGWTPPASDPLPLTVVRAATVPYFMVAAELGDAQAEAVEYPQAYNTVMADAGSGSAYGFQLMSLGVDVTGSAAYQDQGNKGLTPFAALGMALGKASHSTLTTPGDLAGVGAGDLLWIGTDGGEHELALVEGFSETGLPLLRRGVLDTVPQAWPEGAPVWIWSDDLAIEDPQERMAGETVTYRLLTRASFGQLALEDAPDVALTTTDRMHRPLRPANVRIWDTLWPGVVAGYAPAVTVSWSPRNRLQETAQILAWDEGPVAAEPGTTYTLRLHDGGPDADVVQEITGISGTSADMDLTHITGPTATVAVWAMRDGIESLQADHHTFDVAGYGMNYGNYYGGYYG
ncbi:phage tail protein [Azotobacter chroococcum]|uniref:Phage tail protein n=1 Tax=Azotobacter chroococcum TaxID=353 RepID=A0AAP9YGI6_9GAMM|nr:phage tail protein [Azotobacter chroococcum]QQE90278.1 phage tail protein [Azotobacter chroococcum]